MTTALMRDRLISYLSAAGEKEVKEFYALLKGHVAIEDMPAMFTEEQLKILDERRESFVNGGVAGKDWRTVHDNVRNKRNSAG